MKAYRLFFIIGASFLLLACVTQSALKPMSYQHGTKAEYQCPKALPNAEKGRCALYQVPLNWLEQDIDSINVFLRAFPFSDDDALHATSDKPKARGQLWVIDGGPGASGATFSDPKFIEIIHEMGWDLFVPTHRGVGYSTHLPCSVEHQALDESFFNECASELVEQYGSNLNWFSSIGAAHDLDYLLRINNPEKLPVVVMGTSYGTFLTQRFIQLFESSIDAAILLSGTNLSPQFEFVADGQEATFKQILESCDEQTSCAAMFERSAYDTARELVKGDRWQNCPATQSASSTAGFIMGSLASSPSLRAKLAYTIKSMHRCNQEDLKYLEEVFIEIQTERQKQYTQLFQFNPLMLHHQIFMELMSTDRSSLEGAEQNSTNILPSSVNTYISLQANWPSKQAPIDLPTKLASNLPILAIHGKLDMQAPMHWFETLEAQLKGDRQYAIISDEAGHGTPN